MDPSCLLNKKVGATPLIDPVPMVDEVCMIVKISSFGSVQLKAPVAITSGVISKVNCDSSELDYPWEYDLMFYTLDLQF